MPAALEIKLVKNKRSLRSFNVVIVLCLFIMISFGFLSLYGTKVFCLHFEILPRSTKQGFFPSLFNLCPDTETEAATIEHTDQRYEAFRVDAVFFFY